MLAAMLSGCGATSSSSTSANITPGAPHSVTLSWQPSTSSNVVGYNVYRGNQSGSYGLLVSMNSTTSYVDPAVQSGNTYYYVVTAVDSVGSESTYSNQAQAVVP